MSQLNIEGSSGNTISRVMLRGVVGSILFVEGLLFFFSVLNKYFQLRGEENFLIPLVKYSLGRMSLIVVVVFISSILIWYVLNKRIISPNRKIYTANRFITDGNYSKGRTLTPGGCDPFEIREIVKSRNEMLTHMENMQSQLKYQLMVAGEMQKKLLPSKIPEASGFRMSVLYRPLDYAGGDIYDFIEMTDGSLGILVGDVSGHGVGAAMVSMLLKIPFQQYTDNFKNPSRLLSNINESIT